MSSDVQQARLDVLIRVVGLIVLAFGVLLVSYSVVNAGDGLAPEIITINIALGVLLAVVGLLAVIAKFK